MRVVSFTKEQLRDAMIAKVQQAATDALAKLYEELFDGREVRLQPDGTFEVEYRPGRQAARSKQGSEQAYPGVSYTSGYGQCVPIVQPDGSTAYVEHAAGMTKREVIAMHILAALIGKGQTHDAAAMAVSEADELLRVLEAYPQ